jgi:hypothetical protein
MTDELLVTNDAWRQHKLISVMVAQEYGTEYPNRAEELPSIPENDVIALVDLLLGIDVPVPEAIRSSVGFVYSGTNEEQWNAITREYLDSYNITFDDLRAIVAWRMHQMIKLVERSEDDSQVDMALVMRIERYLVFLTVRQFEFFRHREKQATNARKPKKKQRSKITDSENSTLVKKLANDIVRNNVDEYTDSSGRLLYRVGDSTSSNVETVKRHFMRSLNDYFIQESKFYENVSDKSLRYALRIERENEPAFELESEVTNAWRRSRGI